MISKAMKTALLNSSFIRKMFEEGNRLKEIHGEDNVFDFSIGNPDLEPPEEVTDSLRELTKRPAAGMHKYMSNAGYLSTRKSVADFLNDGAKIKVGPENIVMTVGAAGALNVALKALLDPGDEVIIVKPYFVEYFSYVKNHGGVPVTAECEKDTFGLDIEQIKSKITEKTKAIILNSPNNPSGAVYSAGSLAKLNSMLLSLDRTVYVLSDEPYREIVFNGTQVPHTLDILDNIIMCYSWSKSLALPGERIGFLAASPFCEDIQDLMGACVIANRSLGFVNAPAIMQRVIERSIGAKVDVGSYQKRCDMLYDILLQTGYECAKPKGALYLFPKSPLKDDNEFTRIAAKYNLLAVPGSAFGMPGFFRLTFCVSEKTIRNSKKAFEAAIQECAGRENI